MKYHIFHLLNIVILWSIKYSWKCKGYWIGWSAKAQVINLIELDEEQLNIHESAKDIDQIKPQFTDDSIFVTGNRNVDDGHHIEK